MSPKLLWTRKGATRVQPDLSKRGHRQDRQHCEHSGQSPCPTHCPLVRTPAKAPAIQFGVTVNHGPRLWGPTQCTHVVTHHLVAQDTVQNSHWTPAEDGVFKAGLPMAGVACQSRRFMVQSNNSLRRTSEPRCLPSDCRQWPLLLSTLCSSTALSFKPASPDRTNLTRIEYWPFSRTGSATNLQAKSSLLPLCQ